MVANGQVGLASDAGLVTDAGNELSGRLGIDMDALGTQGKHGKRHARRVGEPKGQRVFRETFGARLA